MLYCPQEKDDWLNGTLTSLGGGTDVMNGGTVKLFCPKEPIAYKARVMAGRTFYSNQLPKPQEPKDLVTICGNSASAKAVTFYAVLPEGYAKGVIYYEVSQDKDFSNIILVRPSELLNSEKGSNSMMSGPYTFNDYGTYFWRAWFQDLSGDWETNQTKGLCSDKTTPLEINLGYPDKLLLIYPDHNAKMDGSTLQLSALYPANENLPPSCRVVFQYSRASVFEANMADVFEKISGSAVSRGESASVEITSLTPGDYYWRAYGLDSTNIKTAYSETRKFSLAVAPPGAMECRVTENLINRDNRQCNIHLNISQVGSVSAVIYNLVGEKIKVLVSNEALNPGRYEYTWDGTNENGKAVNSGIYVLETRAKDFVNRRKIAVVR